jgi:putative addiction module component (TIGR02574 family)
VAENYDLCYLSLMSTITLNDVFKLPAQERLRIASALWDSVADQSEQFILTQEQAQELDARYADFLAHPAEGESWLAVKSQILQSR